MVIAKSIVQNVWENRCVYMVNVVVAVMSVGGWNDVNINAIKTGV